MTPFGNRACRAMRKLGDVVVRQARKHDEGASSTAIGHQRQSRVLSDCCNRVGSLRSSNTPRTQNVKRAHERALGNSFRIFEAEFFLVRSQMPALPDWQSISALTDTESFYSD